MKKNILVIASPHTGIFDNILPFIYFSSLEDNLSYDVLISIEKLSTLDNNLFHLNFSLKYFKYWYIVINNQVVKFNVDSIKRYFSFKKIFEFRFLPNNRYLNRIKNISIDLLCKFVFKNNESLLNYDLVFGHIYIFSRKDAASYANKINKIKFLSVIHGVNPYSLLYYKNIYQLPNDIYYLAVTKSEINCFDEKTNLNHKLISNIGMLRHSKSWQDFILNNSDADSNKFGRYILVVSRPPDDKVTIEEMHLYYIEILKFAKLNNISVIVKPHLWESSGEVFTRVKRANKTIDASFFISHTSLIKLINDSIFGVAFYSTVGADFVSLNKVLLQCANENKMTAVNIKAPYGEKIISDHLDFISIATSVLKTPEPFLEKMKYEYQNKVVIPADHQHSLKTVSPKKNIEDFINQVVIN